MPSLPEAGPVGTFHQRCAEKCTGRPQLLCRKVYSSTALTRGSLPQMSPIRSTKTMAEVV